MQAITVHQGKVTYQSAHPDPVPKSDEVLIEVELAGICATDLELVKGYMNFSGVLGHELSAQEDSYADGLLDCPHYTRPEDFHGAMVPE